MQEKLSPVWKSPVDALCIFMLAVAVRPYTG